MASSLAQKEQRSIDRPPYKALPSVYRPGMRKADLEGCLQWRGTAPLGSTPQFESPCSSCLLSSLDPPLGRSPSPKRDIVALLGRELGSQH